LPQTAFGGRKPPRQLIFVGCPGSGKSFRLNSYAKGVQMFRTTFHSEMAYGDFVGAYKPTPVYVESTASTFNADGRRVEGDFAKRVPVVKYDFRPGVFAEAYVTARLAPEKDVILLIEEINRANPAAVFGDIIQLLDRNPAGESEYPITPSPDLKMHLNQMKALPEDARLAMPANLYLWATMNRADENVCYMDSAFLRRWSLDYLPHDDECVYDTEVLSVHSKDVMWGDLRAKLNEKLAAAVEGIEDDKFVGPYFLKQEELGDRRAVFSKLLMYLWYDVVPMERGVLFTGSSLTAIFRRWMDGKAVFTFDPDA
jgi:hypothetical protein